MAHLVLSSDSEEDDYYTPMRSTKATRSKRVINDAEDNPDIDSFSSYSESADVCSGSESDPNESVSPEASPLQLTQKRTTNQRIISDEEEEDTNFLTSKEARKLENKYTKSRTTAPVKRNEATKNAGVVHSSDDSEDNSDINSFSSSLESTDVNAEPESSLNETVNLSQVTEKRTGIATSDEEVDSSFSVSREAENEDTRMTVPVTGDNPDSSSSESSDVNSESTLNESASPLRMTQRGILNEKVNDEEKDPSFLPARKPTINTETASTRTGQQNRDEVKTFEREVNGNKENTTPPSNNSLPEKPLLGAMQTKSLTQMQGVPSKKPPQVMAVPHKAPTYHLAHTRQALLKQLDYVKVRNVKCL